MSELLLVNLCQFVLIPWPQWLHGSVAFGLGFNTMDWADVGIICLLPSYGVLSRSQGGWSFSLWSNTWRGIFRGRVAFGLCFNPTARAIPGGWGGWYSLQSHVILVRPQESCAFFLWSNPTVGGILCTRVVRPLLQLVGVRTFGIFFIPTASLAVLSGAVHFLLCSNPKAGEIPNWLHYSHYLKIYSNQLPPYHNKSGRLSAHHFYFCICRL